MSVPMKVIVRVVAATTVVLSLGGMTQPAGASPPDRFPLTGSVFHFDAGVVCAFPLQATERLHATATIFADGRAHATGDYSIDFLNVDNSRTMTVHAPGPILVPATGPAVGPGPQVFMLFPTDFGGPGIFLYTGRVLVTRDATGTITDIQSVGTRSGNLCDQLT